MQASFHATVVDVQWVVESYGLFLSALILIGGVLGDSLGRRDVRDGSHAVRRCLGGLRLLG